MGSLFLAHDPGDKEENAPHPGASTSPELAQRSCPRDVKWFVTPISGSYLFASSLIRQAILSRMVVVRILVGLIQALLRVLASALTAGIALALVPILGGLALIVIALLSFSGLGTMALFRRRKK